MDSQSELTRSVVRPPGLPSRETMRRHSQQLEESAHPKRKSCNASQCPVPGGSSWECWRRLPRLHNPGSANGLLPPAKERSPLCGGSHNLPASKALMEVPSSAARMRACLRRSASLFKVTFVFVVFIFCTYLRVARSYVLHVGKFKHGLVGDGATHKFVILSVPTSGAYRSNPVPGLRWSSRSYLAYRSIFFPHKSPDRGDITLFTHKVHSFFGNLQQR